MLVDRVLTDLKADYPDIEIEKIDILANPKKSWQAGIRMIPALQDDERTISGIMLNKKEIQQFLDEAKEE